MISQHIQDLLGKELSQRVLDAISANEKNDIDIVCGNDGSFIPMDEYEALKQSLDLQTQNHNAQIAKIQTASAVKFALLGQVHDPNDLMALMDLDQLELHGDGSLKSDLNQLIQPIREKKPYLFRQESPPILSGAQPAPLHPIQPTQQQMNYSQLCTLLEQ